MSQEQDTTYSAPRSRVLKYVITPIILELENGEVVAEHQGKAITAYPARLPNLKEMTALLEEQSDVIFTEKANNR